MQLGLSIAMWLARMTASAAAYRPGKPSDKKRELVRRHTPLDGSQSLASIPAESFESGEFLRDYAGAVVQNGILNHGRPRVKKRSMVIGSGCTGSAMDAIALDALQAALEKEDIGIQFDHAFFVEIDPVKQSWCADVHKCIAPEGGALCAPCAFTDISVFGNDALRHCVTCKGPCAPPAIDGFIAGFSCKDFARCNQNRKLRSGADIATAATSPGKSADTFNGVLQVLDSCNPQWIILENVDELLQENHRSGFDEFMSELSHRTYDVKAFVLNGADYALPQNRKRLYMIGVKRPGALFNTSETQVLFDRITRQLDSYKLPGPSLEKILLDSSHPLVQEELTRRGERAPKGWESSTIESHRQEWARLGLRWQAVRARSSDVESSWYSTLAAREKDIIGFHQHVRRGVLGETASAARLAIVDVGQSISQMTYGTLGEDGRLLAPTILPRSKLWISLHSGDAFCNLREQHRLMHGAEAMMANGWPTNDCRFKSLVEKQKHTLLLNLAGNSFPSTIIVAIVAALLFSAEYGEVLDESAQPARASRDDAADALRLLKRSRSSYN